MIYDPLGVPVLLQKLRVDVVASDNSNANIFVIAAIGINKIDLGWCVPTRRFGESTSKPAGGLRTRDWRDPAV